MHARDFFVNLKSIILLGSSFCMMTVELVGPSMTSSESAVLTLNMNSSACSGIMSPKMIISSHSWRELVEPVGKVKVLLFTTRKSLLSVKCVCKQSLTFDQSL